MTDGGVIKIGRTGKFAEWLTPDGLLVIEGFARDGLTDPQIAHNMGIGYSTLKDWMNRYPAIQAAIKKGKAPVDMQVENALLKRALGYTEEETITEVEEIPYTTKDADGNPVTRTRTKRHVRKVQRVYPPDVTAQIFWLKNRKPKQWREKVETTVAVDTEDLSPLVELLKGE